MCQVSIVASRFYLENINAIILLYKCGHRVHTAAQSQKAVSAYFTSKQILPFDFAEQHRLGILCGVLGDHGNIMGYHGNMMGKASFSEPVQRMRLYLGKCAP